MTNTIINFLEKQPNINTVAVDAQFKLCDLGDKCENLIILKTGQVKVFRLNEEGKSITLYFIRPGESCVLTASCLLNSQPFPAIAISETPAEGYVVPLKSVKAWLSTEPEWQAFIFRLLSDRMADLIETVDHLAFSSIEQRILVFLTRASEENNPLKITHQEIADSLASSREVISRALKRLEKENLIAVQRGQITIL